MTATPCRYSMAAGPLAPASPATRRYRRSAPSWSGGSIGAAVTEAGPDHRLGGPDHGPLLNGYAGRNRRAPGIRPGLFADVSGPFAPILFRFGILVTGGKPERSMTRLTARLAAATEATDLLDRFAPGIPLLQA